MKISHHSNPCFLATAIIAAVAVVGYLSRDDVSEINAVSGNLRQSILVCGIPPYRKETQTEFGRIVN